MLGLSAILGERFEDFAITIGDQKRAFLRFPTIFIAMLIRVFLTHLEIKRVRLRDNLAISKIFRVSPTIKDFLDYPTKVFPQHFLFAKKLA